VTLAIRPIGSAEADLRTVVDIVATVTPETPTSLEDIHWSDATYPGGARFLAEVDGKAVGVATTGRIYMYAPQFDAFWASIDVLAEHRRRGVGSALYRAVSEVAAAAGKRALHLGVSEVRPDGLAFLVHRGFVEHDRYKIVRLELGGTAPPTVDPPAGITLTDLGARPDLVPGVHAVALATFADIPGGSEPVAAGSYEEFRVRDVDRPSIPPSAFFVALDEASGSVVGYASLMIVPGTTGRAWHDMTAVTAAWRGHGLATALKRATIAWAIRNGVTTLETGNDPDNAAMRGVNRALGYIPGPDEITMRGPLFGAIMEA
jgi:mycothiol synthase